MSNTKYIQQEKVLRPESDGYIASLEDKQIRTGILNTIKTNDLDDLKRLEQNYNKLTKEYVSLQKKIHNASIDIAQRASDKNKYRNKNIRLKNGSIGYVTDQGTYKLYETPEIYNKTAGLNGCPTKTTLIRANASINSNNQITTKPSLGLGKQMSIGQACGNEGKNVLASKLVEKVETKYLGCFDDSGESSMKFIGDKPPILDTANIQNGNFSMPLLNNNSYKKFVSSSQVPGWNFNATLVNNSTAWNFKMPYPRGVQCVSIQKTDSISQYINLISGSEYVVSLFSIGRNCCDNSRLGNTLSILVDNVEIYNFTPSITSWVQYSAKFTAQSNRIELKIKGTWESSDRSSAVQGITISNNELSRNKGSYTFDMCKNSALNNGYKYFGLQMIDETTGKGFCAVNNDEVAPKSKGISYIVSKITPLWNSKIPVNRGIAAKVTDQGTLDIIDNNGVSIYSTPNPSNIPSNYIGCYNDNKNRRLPNNLGKKTYDDCEASAMDSNYKYFGLQASKPNNISECWAGNDLNLATSLGKASNCSKKGDVYRGGSWSNAIYESGTPSSTYYLQLNDDGSMTLNKGTSPTDNQGEIWNSQTKGKQRDPNPNMSAAKGKYGRNWIATNETLGLGDFVGSPKGNIFLVLQQNGNLVLNTSLRKQNCKKMSDNIIGGGDYATGLYEFKEIGDRSLLGKMAYIDNDANLREYPKSMVEFSNNYQFLENTDMGGSDIKTLNAKNNSVCQKACSANNDCAAYVYQGNTGNCLLKSSSNGEKNQIIGYTLGIRKPKLKNNVGCSKNTVEIDTVKYSKYVKGEDVKLGGICEKPIVSQKDKIALDNMKNKLSMLGEEIALKMQKLYNRDNKINEKINLNVEDYNSKIEEYKNTRLKLEKELDMRKENMIEGLTNMDIDDEEYFNNEDGEVDGEVDGTIEGLTNRLTGNDLKGMLSDAKLIALKENYSYVMWSILAIGALTATFRIMKK